MICGASSAYGLTSGGYNAQTIELTALGRRIVAPTEEGDDVVAMREAVLRPRVLNEFLTRYDGNPLPSDNIAGNVLEDMSVPSDRTQQTVGLIVQSAKHVGFIEDIQGSSYINLQSEVAREKSSDPSSEASTRGDEDRDSMRTRGPDKPSIQNEQQQEDPKKPAPPVGPAGMPEVRLNLEIRIDANATADQIDQVFASMAKHLYRLDDEGR